MEFGSAAYVVSFVNGTLVRVAQDIGPETTATFKKYLLPMLAKALQNR